MGLLDHVIVSGCPPVARFRFDYGTVALVGSRTTRSDNRFFGIDIQDSDSATGRNT